MPAMGMVVVHTQFVTYDLVQLANISLQSKGHRFAGPNNAEQHSSYHKHHNTHQHIKGMIQERANISTEKEGNLLQIFTCMLFIHHKKFLLSPPPNFCSSQSPNSLYHSAEPQVKRGKWEV